MGEPLSQVDETTAMGKKPDWAVEDKPLVSPETIAAQMKEMSSPQLRFENAIDLFPEDQQESAREYLDIYNTYRAVALEGVKNGDDSPDNIVSGFCNKENKVRWDELKDCKLFHLFLGSGTSEKLWGTLPMDIPEHDWEKFINQQIVPLISKEEEAEEERPAAAA